MPKHEGRMHGLHVGPFFVVNIRLFSGLSVKHDLFWPLNPCSQGTMPTERRYVSVNNLIILVVKGISEASKFMRLGMMREQSVIR